MAQLKSNIWNYFTVCQSDDSKALCICSKDSLQIHTVRGKNVKSYFTKPLWNHLQFKHKGIYENEKCNPSKANTDNLDNPGNTTKGKKQLTIESTLQMSRRWNLEESKAKSITLKICGLFVLNKPFGIKIHGHDKPGARPKGKHQFAKPNIPECDYTIEDALPALQKHFDVSNLSIVKSAEKYTSGIVLLSSSDEMTAKITKSFNITKFQHKPHLIHWAVTSGYPTVPYRKEKVGIKFTEIGNGMRQPVIETDISKRSCKLKKVYSVYVESRTISINNELATGLVEIASSGVRWHFVRVYASARVAPILGDVLYGARMKSFLGIPVKTQLSDPSTCGYEPLSRNLCEKLKLPHGSIGELMIPTMLHLRSIVLPNFQEKNKDFIVTADLPKHFQWTVNQLNLLAM